MKFTAAEVQALRRQLQETAAASQNQADSFALRLSPGELDRRAGFDSRDLKTKQKTSGESPKSEGRMGRQKWQAGGQTLSTLVGFFLKWGPPEGARDDAENWREDKKLNKKIK